MAEQVARQLMDSIVARGLGPGDEVPSELQLAELFGVSRPVVREGLRHLAALNIIELANGKRAVVKPITSELMRTFFTWAVSMERATMTDLQELRRGVEGQSAALAAVRRSDAQLALLRETLRLMRERPSDLDGYGELDLRLHTAIAEAAGNAVLAQVVEAIREPMKEAIQHGLQLMAERGDDLRGLQQRHEEIVDAIAARDAAEARRLMEAHLLDATPRPGADESDGHRGGVRALG